MSYLGNRIKDVPTEKVTRSPKKIEALVSLIYLVDEFVGSFSSLNTQ